MSVVILGVFVADTAFHADRMPVMGETVLGRDFVLGPGGKGSNQAVAAARAGADAHFLTRLGTDDFARLARQTWGDAGVTPHVIDTPESYTGAAFIFLEHGTGQNAIIVSPGAAGLITPADIDANAGLIGGADVFVTQLEQPLDAALRGLEVARAGGARTILNPAPASELPDEMLALCDYITPNETEAETLTGIKVGSTDAALEAARAFRAKGVGAALITLGESGALYHDGDTTLHVPAMSVGKVVDTTGAGDAFNGGFATALSEGKAPEEAVRFGNATAGLSVTRPGAASAMPTRAEIESLLRG